MKVAFSDRTNVICHKLMKGLIHPAFLGACLIWFTNSLTHFFLPDDKEALPQFNLWFAFLIVSYFPAAFLSLEDELPQSYDIGKFLFDVLEVISIYSIFFAIQLFNYQIGLRLWLAFLGLAGLGIGGIIYHLLYPSDTSGNKSATAACFMFFGLLAAFVNFPMFTGSDKVGTFDIIILVLCYIMLFIYYLQKTPTNPFSTEAKAFLDDPITFMKGKTPQ